MLVAHFWSCSIIGRNPQKSPKNRTSGIDEAWCFVTRNKWYHFISNDEVWRQTNQPLLMEIIQARHLTYSGILPEWTTM